MTKKLSEYQKYWIYKKFQHFFKRDACFKFFTSDILLEKFYSCLMETSDIKQLLKKLKREGLDESIQIPRKIGKVEGRERILYYEYPGLAFQMNSLIECWEEVCNIQKNYSGEDLKYSLDLEFEDGFDEVDDVKIDERRRCYGNKPNYHLQFRPQLLNEYSISEHERNLGLPLRINFTKEYTQFNAAVTKLCERLTINDDLQVLVVQTDIESYYHKLKIEFLIKYFESSLILRDLKLKKWLKKLKEEYGFEELPIGWILSGFISNILLLGINRMLNKKLANRLALKLKKERVLFPLADSLRVFSYVDDFIMVIPLKKKENVNHQKIERAVVDLSNELLSEAYAEYISFHKYESKKTKAFVVDKFSVSKLRRNFHDMKVSIPAEVQFGLELGELMVAHDPELVINERNQFSIDLTAASRALLRGNNIRKQDIFELIDNMNSKVRTTEGKYISRVFFLLTAILERERNGERYEDAEEKEIERKIKEFIFETFRFLNSLDFCPVNEWAQFFISFGGLVVKTETYISEIRTLFNNRRAIVAKESDLHVKSYFENIQYELILLGLKNNLVLLDFPDFSEIKKGLLYHLSNGHRLLVGKRINQIDRRVKKNQRKIDCSSSDLVILTSYYYRLFLRPENRVSIRSEYLQDLKKFVRIRSKEGDLFLRLTLFKIFDFSSDDEVKEVLLKINRILNSSRKSNIVRYTESLPKLVRYYSKFTTATEFSRFQEQKKILINYKKNKKFSADTDFYRILKSEKGNSYLGIAYLFSCSSLADILSFVNYRILPVEGQQWMPWRAVLRSFQRVGDKSIRLFEYAYKTFVGVNRTSEIDISELNYFLKLLEEFIKDSERDLHRINNGKTLGVPQVEFEKLIPMYKSRHDKMRITIAPVSYDTKDLNEDTLQFRNDTIRKAQKFKIDAAIEEAIARKSTMLVMPEMTIPEEYLMGYVSKLAKYEIILIAGLEYRIKGKMAQNVTVVSIPVKKELNPLGRNYILFEQVKNFPMADEVSSLKRAKVRYYSNESLYIFRTTFWYDFSVLTCSDFLSLTLRWILQKEIQTLFVPAQNIDNTTYEVLANTCIRDLHCIAVVCNNSYLSKSFTLAPFYKDYQRYLFEHGGKTKPEFHTFEIDPGIFKEVQSVGKGDIPFRILGTEKPNPDYSIDLSKFKQLPPDWNYFK